MKTFITLTAMAMTIGSVAKADIISCTFTEPLASTTYSMTEQTLTTKIESDVTPNVMITKNVSFQIKGPGTFQLIDANKNVLQTLKLNNAGSDGMSDNVYPYDVVPTGGVLTEGGCTSNFLPLVKKAN